MSSRSSHCSRHDYKIWHQHFQYFFLILLLELIVCGSKVYLATISVFHGSQSRLCNYVSLNDCPIIFVCKWKIKPVTLSTVISLCSSRYHSTYVLHWQFLLSPSGKCGRQFVSSGEEKMRDWELPILERFRPVYFLPNEDTHCKVLEE